MMMALRDDAERLRVLEEFRLLDTDPEEAYDFVTTIAAEIAETPIALISLIDAERQWFKSNHGLDGIEQTPRAVAFCAHAIEGTKPFIIPDAQSDPRFAQNPLVVGAPHIRFYAGFPLVTDEGAALGTLCVIDRKPRTLTDRQQRLLSLFSRHVRALFEERRLRFALADANEALDRRVAERTAALAESLAARDRALTDLQAARQQFLQSQKMEALGRLAGGIAHDFNNLIMVMRSFAELAQAATTDGQVGQAAADLATVITTADGAASLVQQLLSFSHRDVRQLAVLDLNHAVSAALRIIDRLLGDDIELATSLDDAVPRVRLDPTQLEQVLLNLAVNARDAMPQGGTLRICTHPTPDGEAALDVIDTGTGMPDDVREHIFEPFFTTKPRGEGTGLGLSTVYGIVTQAGGHIDVTSAPGEGTTFRVRLPAAPAHEIAAQAAPPPEPTPAPPPRGPAHVLLVEDDDRLAGATARVLRRAGYTVTLATRPDDALAQVDAGLTLDALVTDLVMPGMDGMSLRDRVRERRPGVPCILMSGYADRAISRDGVVLTENEMFLRKPFPLDQLCTVLDGLLGAGRAAGGQGK